MGENGGMSVERFAVNAVSDRISTCHRLAPEILSGDKVPITDGHIDFYSSDEQSNKTLEGRVPVQVKGRVVKTKNLSSRDRQSFSVEREVLQFFRNNGGGLYFYVPMLAGGKQRRIFYASLLPFKIDHLFDEGGEEQKTFTITLDRLPAEPQKMENIVRLAWMGRAQSAAKSGNAHLVEQAESLTIHSLDGVNESRPTRLALSETDYVVVAQLAGGIQVALDIELEIFPPEYINQELAISISCAGVEFANCSGRRVDEKTTLIQLSDGLELQLVQKDGQLSTSLTVSQEGSFREQAKNFDFMIASAAGNPWVFGDATYQPHGGDPKIEARLQKVRAELASFIELFDELGVDDDLTAAITIDPDMKRMLLALHQGIVQDRPVQGTSDGSGRIDIAIGPYKIMVIIMPAEDEKFRLIVDPFDPAKRDRFRMYRLEGGDSPASIEFGTAYDAMTPEDLARVINLRLRGIVATYAALEDRETAVSIANLTMLRLLLATDVVSEPHHHAYLLQGAIDLCEWLLSESPDSLIHRINWWQIQHRQGLLSESNLREIRLARRSLETNERQAGLLEACLLILLGDMDELDVVISELESNDVASLKSWPIWALTKEIQ